MSLFTPPSELWIYFLSAFETLLAAITAITMPPKKVSGKDSGVKKKRMMSMELKQEIIEKHEAGTPMFAQIVYN